MNQTDRAKTVQRAMALAESYNNVLANGGTLTPEAQCLLVLANEYQELSQVALMQAETIQSMTNDNEAPKPVEPASRQAATPVFDIIPDGSGITIKPSE